MAFIFIRKLSLPSVFQPLFANLITPNMKLPLIRCYSLKVPVFIFTYVLFHNRLCSSLSTTILRSRLRTCSEFRSAHCHTVITCHPSLRSKRAILSSRFLFPSIFLFQNLLLLFGSLALLQLEWLCQKQPCTKTTVFAEVTRKSGSPGKNLTFLLYFTFSYAPLLLHPLCLITYAIRSFRALSSKQKRLSYPRVHIRPSIPRSRSA